MPGLSLRFDGPAVIDHTIDISVLAPALVAVSDLVQQGRRDFFPDAPAVHVRLKETGNGSFVAYLDLQHWADQAISLLNSEGVDALKTLLALLFSTTGLAGAIKWLRGRQPTKVTQDQHSVILETADGDRLIIPVEVWQAYESPRFRRTLEHLVEPVDTEGIDYLEMTAENSDPVRVSSDEVKYFRAPRVDSEIVTDETFAETLTVHTTKSESSRWWFRDSRKELIRVDIEDTEFLDQYRKSTPDNRIGGTDQLRVRLRLVQREDPITGQINSEYTIVAVNEILHSAAPHQDELGLGDTPPDSEPAG